MQIPGIVRPWRTRYWVVLITFTVVVAPASVEAGLRWCYTDQPDAIFCDDFDQYCCPEHLGCTDGAGLPPGPEYTCEPVPGAGCDKDNYKALAVWKPIECGARINLDEHRDCGSCNGFPVTAPFGAKYPKGEQGYHNVHLDGYAYEKWGCYTVQGTDENPLVLEFVLNGQTDSKLHLANTYMELAFVDRINFIDHRAPTDYIFSERCVYEPAGIDISHPIICQQDIPPAGCPDIASAPHHGSIAVGALSYLDKNPCECCMLPVNSHLAVFDGYKWWSLPAFFNGQGTFEIGDGYNHIRLTLFGITMKVELVNNAGIYSWCEMPRDYQGAFNKLSLGFGKACLIDANTWTCANIAGTNNQYQCIPTVSYSQNNYVTIGPVYDNIALYGGEGIAFPPIPKGACCLKNNDCLDNVYEFDCVTFHDGTWQGAETTCATAPCCPDPFADADGDGDVDQVDFAAFQLCFTGPDPLAPEMPAPEGKCTCFDRSFMGVGDQDVDYEDFIDFEACWSGPTVPADPACDDNLHM